MKREGISHDNFYGAQLFGLVGYHDFEGITLYDDERSRMLESIGGKVRQRCADDALRLVEHAQFAELVFDAQVRRMKQQRGW